MNHEWEKEAICDGDDVNLFFEKYEESLEIREEIDSLCSICPVAKQCFAAAVATKAWGVRGGVYLENGKISREFNKHKTKQDWANTWQNLTMDKE